MVIPIGNIKVTCLDCGWHKVIYQPSDVVFLPKSCQKCKGMRLETQMMGTPKSLLQKLLKLWR